MYFIKKILLLTMNSIYASLMVPDNKRFLQFEQLQLQGKAQQHIM
jgi:hypothetical protein